jgi:histone acetyltransferase (RNA polymerase elongator complex component)
MVENPGNDFPQSTLSCYCRSFVASQPVELAFYGGSFTAIPIKQQNELLEAAQPFMKLDPLNSIRISTRPDCLDVHAIERLKNFGVAAVELGAQSMCDDVLGMSQRGHTASDVEQAAALVKSSGLTLILQMMTGLPGDTREKSLYTARRFVELKADGVRIYPTVVVRGTKLHKLWEDGDYKEHTIDCAVRICAELYSIFSDAGITVIRMGLNPSRTLSAGDAVAGAYHPAFGELVYSRVYYEKAAALLDDVTPGSDVTLAVPHGHVSMMIGQHRRNINALVKTFSLRSLKVIQADLGPEEQMRIV